MGTPPPTAVLGMIILLLQRRAHSRRQWLVTELRDLVIPLCAKFQAPLHNGRLIRVNRLIFTGQDTKHFGLWVLLHIISQAINQPA